jgi:hypothetical protein
MVTYSTMPFRNPDTDTFFILDCSSSDAAARLAYTISRARRVQDLVICGPQGAAQPPTLGPLLPRLENLFQAAKALSYLSISYLSLDEPVMMTLSIGLKSSRSLDRFALQTCQFQDDNVTDLFIATVQQQPTLRRMTLTNCNFSSPARGDVVAKLLQGSALAELEFTGSFSPDARNYEANHRILGKIEREPSIKLNHLILPHLSHVEVIDATACLRWKTKLRKLTLRTLRNYEDFEWHRLRQCVRSLYSWLRENGSLYEFVLQDCDGVDFEFMGQRHAVQAFGERNRCLPALMQLVASSGDGEDDRDDEGDVDLNRSSLQCLMPSLLSAATAASRTAPRILLAGLMAARFIGPYPTKS